MNGNISFFFWLSVIANLLQVENYNLLLKDKTNNDIMQELQQQDKVLNEEINKYLKQIISQNEEIIKTLKKK